MLCIAIMDAQCIISQAVATAMHARMHYAQMFIGCMAAGDRQCALV